MSTLTRASEAMSRRTKRSWDGPLTALVATLFVIAFAYIMSKALDLATSSALADLTAGLVLSVAFASTLRGGLAGFGLLLPLLALFGTTLYVATSGGSENTSALIRYVTTIGVLFGLSTLPVKDLRKPIGAFASVLLLVIVGASLLSGEVAHAGTERLGPALDNLHNTSIAVAGLTALVWSTVTQKVLRRAIVLIGIAALVGYGVLTAGLMLAVFAIGTFMVRRGISLVWLAVSGMVLGVVGIFVRYTLSAPGGRGSQIAIDTAGSGRLGSWLARWEVFLDRPVVSKLLGEGVYSDYRVVETWWWDSKNAHSDIVTIGMEFGLLGIAALLVAAVLLIRRSRRTALPAIFAVFFGMAISNTLLDRPMAALVWATLIFASQFGFAVDEPAHGGLRQRPPRRTPSSPRTLKHSPPMR